MPKAKNKTKDKDHSSDEICAAVDLLSEQEVFDIVVGSDVHNSNDVLVSMSPESADNTEQMLSKITGSKRVMNSESSEKDEDTYTLVDRKKKRVMRRTSREVEYSESDTITMKESRNKSVSRQQSTEMRGTKSADGEIFAIIMMCREVLPKQIALAKLLSESKVEGVIQVRYKGSHRVELHFESEVYCNKIRDNTVLKDKGMTFKGKNEKEMSHGVVNNIDMNLDCEELKAVFECDTEIISVERLDRKSGEKWLKSGTLKITFRGPTLPPYVQAYGLRCSVKPYVFRVMQCTKCWRYGHVATFCPNTTVKLCPKCGDKHENCTTVDYKCVNCKGTHMSLDKLCPMYTREKEVREVMAKENCTYREARLRRNKPPKEDSLTLNKEPSERHQMTTAADVHVSADMVNSTQTRKPVTPHREQVAKMFTGEEETKHENQKMLYCTAVNNNRSTTTVPEKVTKTHRADPAQKIKENSQKDSGTKGNTSIISQIAETIINLCEGKGLAEAIESAMAKLLEYVKTYLFKFISDNIMGSELGRLLLNHAK